MKRYGNPKLKTAGIDSNRFASDKEFNKLVVNSLSEVDQETLDHEVIIFNKEDDKIYTYNAGFDSWLSIVDAENDLYSHYTTLSSIYIDDVQDTYNCYWFDEVVTNYLSVDKDLFDFGPIGSPEDFVIDFWIINYPEAIYNGTILYNGLNTGQVDLEINKNLLITTSGSVLIKDPNFQVNPTTQLNAADDGYLNVYRPRLKSLTPIANCYMKHVAIIRSGITTYLAIDGKIEASAPSVEYFHYDPIKIGSGYVGAFGGGIVNLRVSKGTDRGWTTDFDPPNYNPDVDANTDFLMTSGSFVDETSNYTVTVVGTPTPVKQNLFYYQLNESHYGSIIKTNLSQDRIVFRLPKVFNNEFLYFDSQSKLFEIISFVPQIYLDKYFYKFKISGLSFFTSNNNSFLPFDNDRNLIRTYSIYQKYSGKFNTSYSSILHVYDDVAWLNFYGYATNYKIYADIEDSPTLMPFKDSFGVINCHNREHILPSYPGGVTHFQLNFLFYLTEDITTKQRIVAGDGVTPNSVSIDSGNIISFELNDGQSLRLLVGSGYPILKNTWYNMVFRFYYSTSAFSSQTIFTFAPYETNIYPQTFYGYGFGSSIVNTFVTKLPQGPWYISCLKYFIGTDRGENNFKYKYLTEGQYLLMI